MKFRDDITKVTAHRYGTAPVNERDSFGVVIPKELRRTMRIRESDPSHSTLTLEETVAIAVHSSLKK